LQTGLQPVVALQVFVPLTGLQASPQPRQFDVVPRVVSQPAWALQSARPALQPVSTHSPVPHDSVPPARSQLTPQPAQFVRLVRAVSQPSGLDSSLQSP
jgi:hypothetical protein